jgi:RNA polymerase sigma factor (sigma-70 family)
MLSDNDLIRAYANSGDEGAFAEIVGRHAAMVYRVCLRVLGDRHAAEDASQATFEVLVRKARSLRGGVDLASWLHGVARKAALMARRTASRRTRREEEAMMLRSSGNTTGAGEEPAVAELLDGELGRLPKGERQAVILRHLEGRSEAESAKVIGCPLGTLSRRASQGLSRLRDRLSRRGVSLGVAALAGLFQAEAAVAIPEALLPSMLAATKTAAVGATGAGAGVSFIAEGVLKAMLWTKIKIAAAVIAAITVVAGAGTPLALRAVAGGKKGPEVAAKPTADDPEKKPVSSMPAAAKAVNGLRLRLLPVGIDPKKLPAGWKLGPRGSRNGPHLGVFCPRHGYTERNFAAGKMPKCAECGKQTMFKYCGACSLNSGRCIRCGIQVPAEARGSGFKLRWENVGKKRFLTLVRDRCCDLYDRVFMKGSDGKLVSARTDNRMRKKHAPAYQVKIAPGKHDEERFDPWHWVVRLAKGGEYTLWVEFEQKVSPKQPIGPAHWIGKVRSNAVKIKVGGVHRRSQSEREAVKELYAKGRKGDLSAALKDLAHESDWVRFSAADCIGTFGKAEHYPIVLARLGKEKPGDLSRGGIIFAMGRLGGKRALGPLLSLLAGANRKDCGRAASALRRSKELSKLSQVRTALEKYGMRRRPKPAPSGPEEVF